MSFEEKFREGLRLFDLECEAISQEFRALHPGLDEDHITAMLRARLAEQRRLERSSCPNLLP